uniref:Uncharacterized protein n=1 Tax=Amphimedon queenslandica TaxID=400682 RepID=A0A1X7TXK3_AMPQE
LILITFAFLMNFLSCSKTGQNPYTINNAVALLIRIHPTSKWLPQLLQPCYTGKTSSYAYQTS